MGARREFGHRIAVADCAGPVDSAHRVRIAARGMDHCDVSSDAETSPVAWRGWSPRAQPRAYYGMLLAHCGVAVFIAGVTLVKGYETERDVRMAVGDSVTVGGYTFRFDGVRDAAGPNYRAVRGAV